MPHEPATYPSGGCWEAGQRLGPPGRPGSPPGVYLSAAAHRELGVLQFLADLHEEPPGLRRLPAAAAGRARSAPAVATRRSPTLSGRRRRVLPSLSDLPLEVGPPLVWGCGLWVGGRGGGSVGGAGAGRRAWWGRLGWCWF